MRHLRRPPTFFLSAVVFTLLTAGYHAVAICRGSSPPGESSPGRHGVFVGINLALALGFWCRPPWFVWVFGLLALQQVYSHGGRAITWAASGRVDWVSLLVLVVLPVAFAELVRDTRQRRQRAR